MKVLPVIAGLTVANAQSGLKGGNGTQKVSRSLYYEPPTTICKPDCSDSSKWRAVSWIGDGICDDGTNLSRDCANLLCYDNDGGDCSTSTTHQTGTPTVLTTSPTGQPTAEPTSPTEQPTAEPTSPTSMPTVSTTSPTGMPTIISSNSTDSILDSTEESTTMMKIMLIALGSVVTAMALLTMYFNKEKVTDLIFLNKGLGDKVNQKETISDDEINNEDIEVGVSPISTLVRPSAPVVDLGEVK